LPYKNPRNNLLRLQKVQRPLFELVHFFWLELLPLKRSQKVRPSELSELPFSRGPLHFQWKKIWDQVHTKFLLAYGFQQSVVDRRMFYFKAKAKDSE
jgi:hypothetical protein